MIGLPFKVEGWQVGAVLGALALAVMGFQQVRISGLRAELAEAGTKLEASERRAADERATAERVGREWSVKYAALQAEHAVAQQEKEDAWNRQKAALDEQRRADSVQLAGLRNKLKAFSAATPGRGAASGADTTTVVDQADRPQVVASLLDEALGLLFESRGVVEQRDAEVANLLEQIRIDRAACGRQKSQVPEKAEENTT